MYTQRRQSVHTAYTQQCTHSVHTEAYTQHCTRSVHTAPYTKRTHSAHTAACTQHRIHSVHTASERHSICPLKECTFIKHPLMGFRVSQEGMLLALNTTKKDKNVPLLPYKHYLKDSGSMKIFHC